MSAASGLGVVPEARLRGKLAIFQHTVADRRIIRIQRLAKLGRQREPGAAVVGLPPAGRDFPALIVGELIARRCADIFAARPAAPARVVIQDRHGFRLWASIWDQSIPRTPPSPPT